MSNRFASGKKAIAECDRCGQQYRLSKLKTEIIKTKKTSLEKALGAYVVSGKTIYTLT